jgi:hypothetical protein
LPIRAAPWGNDCPTSARLRIALRIAYVHENGTGWWIISSQGEPGGALNFVP